MWNYASSGVVLFFFTVFLHQTKCFSSQLYSFKHRMENEIRNIHRKFQFQLELSMKYYQIYGARTGLHKHAHIYIHVKPSVKLNLIGIRTTFDWTYIRDHGIDFQVILLCSCRNYDLKIFMSFFQFICYQFSVCIMISETRKE